MKHRQWYNDPTRILDAEDYAGRATPSALYERHLHTPVFPRETERVVFTRMIAAVQGRGVTLTDEQRAALQLEFEARAVWCVPAARYIAEKRGTSLNAARVLLRRAKMRELEQMYVSDPRLTLQYTNERQAAGAKPSQDDIIKRQRAMKKRCAGDGSAGCRGEISGMFDLCPVCRKRYGEDRSDYPAWLLAEIARLRREHRKAAVESLWREGALEDEG